jgi:hypothetical protein
MVTVAEKERRHGDVTSHNLGLDVTQARQIGLQAPLMAWQAYLLAYFQPKYETGLRAFLAPRRLSKP